jgi:predicted lipoprotein with Yx(FWY)xxD motif
MTMLLHAKKTSVVIVALLAATACAPATTSPNTAPAQSATPTPLTSTSPAMTPTPDASTSSGAASGVQVSTATIPGLGAVLVNAQGRTLYTFAPDNDAKVTCDTACAAVWPPLSVATGQTPVAAGSVQQSLLGTDSNPSGGQVATYKGWPLYTYVADTTPGQATGQALDLNGGLWYVISPDGTVITQKA